MDLSLFCQNNLLYTQESLSKYGLGGYHPVKLGDTFKNGRYKIHHKLGWGGFSTVWLAKDRVRNQWTSLKIMTGDSRVSRELQNVKHLERNSRGNLSSHYIVQLLDSFAHEGPSGVHQCLVFELLGPSVDKVLADYHESHDKLRPETILRMSTQLLKAVRFIHSVGMCHGGEGIFSTADFATWHNYAYFVLDISGRNIAFSCTHLSSATEEELFKVLGFPEIEPLAHIDGTPSENGLPTQLVKAAEWVEWVDEDEEEIRLLDIGESFLHGEEPKKLAQPGPLRVPETIFTDCFDYRVDLWRTGCMIYSFLFTTYPFWYLGSDTVLVIQMIGFVERLPAEWESKWRSMQMGSSHGLKVEEDCEMSKLERKFVETVHDQRLKPLLHVTRRLMRFLPSSRITADEALDLLHNTK